MIPAICQCVAYLIRFRMVALAAIHGGYVSCSDSSRRTCDGLLTLTFTTVLVFSNNAQAVTLTHAESVELEPGDLLTQTVEWQRTPGQRVEIKLEDAPAGAKLLVNRSGDLYMSWQTGPDLPSETTLFLVARDVDTRQLIQRSELLVVRKAEYPEAKEISELPAPPSPADPTESTETEKLLGRALPAKPDRPEFKPLAHQYLEAGEPWHLEIDVESMSSDPLQFMARGMPEGATMSIAPDGSYDLDWTPASTQLGEHNVMLRAINADETTVFTEQQLVITVKPSALTQPKVIQTAKNWKAPQLNPLPNQIISAGRVVSFQVKPITGDGQPAILQVDRLPRNASFDENKDGSRTFYWQTSDKDQGEHLFRFTAIHPKDGNFRSWREILIVVGDPSRSSTAPVNTPQGSIE